VHGDFAGLDDLFTEHPRVVRGMIEIFQHWLRDTGIDGYRIDTMKHVNAELLAGVRPRDTRRSPRAGPARFLQFGEVIPRPAIPNT